MIVRISHRSCVRNSGGSERRDRGPATLGAAVDALDARFPGLRFRIVDEQHAVRPHIKMFVDGALVRDLAAPIPAARELMIVGALSGRLIESRRRPPARTAAHPIPLRGEAPNRYNFAVCLILVKVGRARAIQNRAPE
jgi:hypothetical protein